jgi:hypothetical protein
LLHLVLQIRHRGFAVWGATVARAEDLNQAWAVRRAES